jgi:ABC-2 type transport system ATP-binding protein
MTWIIETHQLTKRYPLLAGWKSILNSSAKGKCAVENIDLTIKAGELFGLVGPNGAGKTTLIKMLSTLIIPTSGEIHIDGYDIRDETNIKKTIGLATSDERSFYWRLTGRQNLQFFASLHNLSIREAHKRIEKTLAQVNLTDVANMRFQTYSTGMRQRLTIARAMLTNPKIIFMDEPTKGLDPPSAANLQKLIREHLIESLGITVLLSSHHLKEVEDICDRVAVMNNGTIRGCGTMAELRTLLGPVEQYRMEVYDIDTAAIAQLNASEAELETEPTHDGGLLISFKKDAADDRLTRMIKIILENNGKIQSISCDPVSLHTIFDHLTKEMTGEKVAPASLELPPVISETKTDNPGKEGQTRQTPTPQVVVSKPSMAKRMQFKMRTFAALIINQD